MWNEAPVYVMAAFYVMMLNFDLLLLWWLIGTTQKQFWLHSGTGQSELQHVTPEMSAALLDISMYVGTQVSQERLENHHQ